MKIKMIRVPYPSSGKKPTNQLELDDAERIFKVDIKDWLDSIPAGLARDNIILILQGIQDEAETTGTESFAIPWDRFSISQTEAKKIILNLWYKGFFEFESQPRHAPLPEDRGTPVISACHALDRRLSHDLSLINQEIAKIGGWNNLWLDLRPIRLERLRYISIKIKRQAADEELPFQFIGSKFEIKTSKKTSETIDFSSGKKHEYQEAYYFLRAATDLLKQQHSLEDGWIIAKLSKAGMVDLLKKESPLRPSDVGSNWGNWFRFRRNELNRKINKDKTKELNKYITISTFMGRGDEGHYILRIKMSD